MHFSFGDALKTSPMPTIVKGSSFKYDSRSSRYEHANIRRYMSTPSEIGSSSFSDISNHPHGHIPQPQPQYLYGSEGGEFWEIKHKELMDLIYPSLSVSQTIASEMRPIPSPSFTIEQSLAAIDAATSVISSSIKSEALALPDEWNFFFDLDDSLHSDLMESDQDEEVAPEDIAIERIDTHEEIFDFEK